MVAGDRGLEVMTGTENGIIFYWCGWIGRRGVFLLSADIRQPELGVSLCSVSV